MSSSENKHLCKRLHKFAQPTVWHEFTPLAHKHKAINLGQGFPGWQPPTFVQDALAEAARPENFMEHQYARSAGHMPLCEVVAKKYSKFLSRPINPATEVCITNGASGALFQTIHGLVDPGDEVVLITPAFDLYFAQTESAGGIVKTVPLRRRSPEGIYIYICYMYVSPPQSLSHTHSHVHG